MITSDVLLFSAYSEMLLCYVLTTLRCLVSALRTYFLTELFVPFITALALHAISARF